MTTTIQKWGNSQGIRIPKFLLDAVQWSDDEQLVLSADKNKIIIEKAEPRKNIMNFLLILTANMFRLKWIGDSR